MEGFFAVQRARETNIHNRPAIFQGMLKQLTCRQLGLIQFIYVYFQPKIMTTVQKQVSLSMNEHLL